MGSYACVTAIGLQCRVDSLLRYAIDVCVVRDLLQCLLTAVMAVQSEFEGVLNLSMARELESGSNYVDYLLT